MRKLRTDFGATDIYKFYCKTTGNPLNLSMAELTQINKEFYEAKISELILKGNEFAMPHLLGGLRVARYKMKIKMNKDGKLDKRRLAPNWIATKRLWAEQYPGLTPSELKLIKGKQIIYHTNRHTDGFTHKWYWDRSTCIAKNSSGYTIEICRAVDRKLAKYLQDEELNLDFMLLTN